MSMKNTKLTMEEMEFIRKYRKLSDYDRGRVDQMIDDLRRPPDWEIVKDDDKTNDGENSHED